MNTPDISPASRNTPLVGPPEIAAQYQQTALVLPPGLSFEQWESIGTTLMTIEAGSSWWVGDWLGWGEHEYGEKYAQAVEGTAWKIKTLQNMVWVASRFETSRRREVLSWSHHAEVAALDPADQDELLDRAEAESWSRTELRAAVRDLKRNRLPAPKPTENKSDLTPEELAEFGPEPEYDAEHELDLALADVRRLEALVESLSASDLGTEVRKWSARYAQLEGRVVQLTRTASEAAKQATWQGNTLRKIRQTLGVEKTGEIMPALLRIVNVG